MSESPELRIARARARTLTEEQLTHEARQFINRPGRAEWREAVLDEVGRRLTALAVIRKAERDYKQMLSERRHGGVAAGLLADAVFEALK